MKLRPQLLLIVLASAAPAAADPTDIDVSQSEYLDVLETSDGSIWKGVVIEQTPGVQYKLATSDGSVHVIAATNLVKLTKVRNPRPRRTAALEGGEPLGVEHRAGSSMPRPYARTGLRVDGELDVVFPTGFWSDAGVETSFAPTFRVGYETLFGNFGLAGGMQARFTYWRLPGEVEDVTWQLETHLFGRAALHLGRATPYTGVSIGTDAVYFYRSAVEEAETSLGFGANLQAGLEIAAADNLAVGVGLDYHPGTNSIPFGVTESISYVALRVGASGRF
ncbi:MAG TPA: hypothetical protein VFQ53_27435 [Kofleriaceae bacterium]|nr:hypothetical protein [Kofleriaceae bacterium]